VPASASAHSAGPAGGQLSALARASRRLVYRFTKSRSPRLHEQCVEGKGEKKKKRLPGNFFLVFLNIFMRKPF
jgi:hypothetical protein